MKTNDTYRRLMQQDSQEEDEPVRLKIRAKQMDLNRTVKNRVTILVIMVVLCNFVGADPVVAETPVSEVLAKYGLPIGLLPDSVKNYSVADDGSFGVQLDGPCYVQFNYLVYYEKTVTGKLSYGKITDLDGIQAKQFFFWIDVIGIKVDETSPNYIYFDVGLLSKKIEASWFKSVPTCKNYFENKSCNQIEAVQIE